MAKQVLIVDDDQNAVKYLSAVLSDNGYDSVSAADGSEGLRQVQQTRPDLIVLDVMMPKKSGFVMLQQLRKDDQHKDIPVLMLTAVSGILDEMETHKDETGESPYDSLREALRKKIQEMRQEGLLKPEMFVDKPVDPDAFMAKVGQLIGN